MYDTLISNENRQELSDTARDLFCSNSVLDYDVITSILLALSQYRHYAYFFLDRKNWAVCSQLCQHPCQSMKQLGSLFTDFKDLFNVPESSEEFHQLQQLIYKDRHLHPKSMSFLMIEDTSFNQMVMLVLFSEDYHHVEPAQAAKISEYMRQQQEFVTTQVENTKLKNELANLEEANVGRSKYFAMIAHDLRAPFHGIMGCADILLHEADTLDEDAENRLVQYVYDTSNSTYALLEGLLSWSIAHGGKFHVNQVHFRLNDVVQNIFDLLFASAYKKDIALQADLELGIFVYADMHMVTSILQNLISNALKFTVAESKRKILVKAETIQDRVQITIQDEGVGMTLQQIERLFQETTNQSTQGTSAEKGMGMGLALCKQFLELNNGQLSISSEVDKGTSFIISLPCGDKYA